MLREADLRPYAVLAAAFAVFLVLEQRSAFSDGAGFLLMNREGATWQNHAHVLYLPLLDAWCTAWSWFGVAQYDAAVRLSAVGVTVGLFGSWRAVLALTGSRPTALRALVLTATCPSVVFVATVVEIPGAFFAVVGVGAWMTARLARRPTVWRALALGCVTGVGYGVHSSGQLLPILLLTVFCVAPRNDAGTRRRVALAATVLLVHVTIVTAGPILLTRAFGAAGSAGGDLGFLQAFAEQALSRPTAMLAAIGREWFWAYAPLSVVWLAGFARSKTRKTAVAILIAGSPYLVVTAVILLDADEHGGYLLPLSWCVAWVTATALPRTVVIATAVLGGILAVVQIERHDDRERVTSYAAGLSELAGERGIYLLIGGYFDGEALAIARPDIEYLRVPQLVSVSAAELLPVLPLIDQEIARRIDAGEAVFLTAEADEMLRHHPNRDMFPAATLLLRHFEQSLVFEPVRASGFAGFRVGPRDR